MFAHTYRTQPKAEIDIKKQERRTSRSSSLSTKQNENQTSGQLSGQLLRLDFTCQRKEASDLNVPHSDVLSQHLGGGEVFVGEVAGALQSEFV